MSRSPFRWTLVLGAVLVITFASAAALSFVWTPFDVEKLAIANKLMTPSGTHWLGTDHFGRDILSMIMVGARVSIAVAVVAVGIGMLFGVPLGLMAAARRGSWIDDAIMRGNDLVFAFPALLIAILITASFGPGAVNAIVAIGIFNIPVFARLTRGAALSLWTREFVLAARVAGKGGVRISVEHILPNLTNLLIVQGTIQFSLGILAEAGLSYVGLGAQPPLPSWGRMLAEGQTLITLAPHIALFPGLAIVLTVLGLNLLGDGLRDWFDPRLRRAMMATPEPESDQEQEPGAETASALAASTTLLAPASSHVPSPEAAFDATALLSVRKLTLAIHDQPILHGLNLDVDRGQVVGIIGESGSGKSLLALSIMQLLPGGSVLDGEVTLDGQSLLSLDEEALCALRGQDIAMVFQEPMTALNPVHSIGQQVAECIRLHRGVGKREAWSLAGEALSRVGLPASRVPLERYPHELSGGQRQRVVIAMAVALGPRLLIADEPTTALDVTTQAGILELLKDLMREHDMALMLISHDLAVVADIADSVVIMRRGHIVEQGPRQSVFTDLHHPYTRQLFEASSHVPARRAGDAPPEVLLEVEALRCEYPMNRRSLFGPRRTFRAVDDVSFTVRRGESVGLVGESGSGKSTLTRALLGLSPAAGGTVIMQGQTMDAHSGWSNSLRRQIQVVFQDPYGSFNPRHTVQRLVAEPLHLLESVPSAGEKRRLVANALESVGLAAADAKKYIHEFSGGQRQRIAIARALIVSPALIVLDEAVSALDVSVRAQVLDLLAHLGDEQQLAYLFISHDLSVVRNVTDRVLVMQGGCIVESGSTEQVFQTPGHDYTRGLLAAAPVLLT